MVTWEDVEAVVERAVVHFGKAAVILTNDGYVTEMAVRHAIQCGGRELSDAISMLQRLHPKSAGYSLMSDESRKAYLAIRALEYEEMVEPSGIDTLTLQDAIAAASVFAGSLTADFKRIRREIPR
ncbi:hypothetical protein [Mesorhizobium sp. A623]